MKTAILLHGMPTEDEYLDEKGDAQSNSHWFPWLQQQLLAHGILAQTPELPDACNPNYEKWKLVFDQFVVDEETILVGHSAGAGFLVRWLSEEDARVGKVILVAPWLDPHHKQGELFNFELDAAVPERTKGLTIFISNDDDPEMLSAVSLLSGAWPAATVIKMEGRGHFTLEDMGTREFPELKEAILD
jgi:predicted alpha/beta hydrolase family esterase